MGLGQSRIAYFLVEKYSMIAMSSLELMQNLSRKILGSNFELSL